MNDVSHNRVSCVFKEAWQKVKGMKRHFWASVILFTIIGLGGFSLIGLILVVGKIIYMPHLISVFYTNPTFFMSSSFVIPVGMIGFVMAYHLGLAIYEMLVLLPMRMGIRLIPLRRIADKSVHTLFAFKFFTWNYIWRFIALDVLVVLMVGVPAVIAGFLFCAPKMYLFGMGLKIVSYIVGVLFYLLALYLVVGYTFVNLLIIDRDVHPWTAMRLSREAVNKKWFCVFGTLVLLGIILSIATVFFLVGLIWVVPFSLNVIAILYRDMLGIEGKDPVSRKEAAELK